MELTPELKAHIDKMSYYSMLLHWRFAAIGTAIFQDESGEYYTAVMNKKKAALPAGEASRISKDVGWD